MNSELIESRSNFGLHLEGDNVIDANLLSDTIRDIAELTKLAAKEENPEADLKMKVTAFRNGSFEIDFSAVILLGLTILSNPETFASTVITIVKGIFEIKKLLKGEKPKSIKDAGNGNIEVMSADGGSIIAPKASETVINNINIDTLVMNIAKNAKDHNPSGRFSLITQSGDFTCDAEDIFKMLAPIPREEIAFCKRLRTETHLHIKKPDLVGRSAWDFKYKGKIITAKIEDDAWVEGVNTGRVAIRAGDYINATIEINMEIDEVGNQIPDTEKYSVIKVHGDIVHDDAEQTSLL